MKKIFLLCVFALVACDSSKTKDQPAQTDPLKNLYGNYLLECTNFGGGPRNQVFAKLNTNGELETVVLTWSADNCSGVYSLSDFDGNPLIAPAHEQDFEYVEVEGAPEDFLVLKITNTNSSDVTYAIFNQVGNQLHVLTDIETMPTTWAKALENADIKEFANNPATATPSTYGIMHFNKGDLPRPDDSFVSKNKIGCPIALTLMTAT